MRLDPACRGESVECATAVGSRSYRRGMDQDPNEAFALVALPEWMWGGNPRGFVEASGLKARDAQDGLLRVQTAEAYQRSSPDLVKVRHLDVPCLTSRQMDVLDSATELTTISVEPARIQQHLDSLGSRLKEGGGVFDMLAHARGVIGLVPTGELRANADWVLRELRAVPVDDASPSDPGPFAEAGLHLMTRETTLLSRLRFPSFLLRVEHDPALRSGDTNHLSDLDEMMFPSAHGLYSGIYMFQEYVGPIQAALAPSIWSVAAPRTFGYLFMSLGRAISGTKGEATESLQLIMVDGPDRAYAAGPHSQRAAVDALGWWARALNDYFGVMSDPATFVDQDGIYQPIAHLQAILTGEQLFSRVTSLLVAHRDKVARRALMFTCLDSLETLTGRSVLKCFEIAHARKVLDGLEQAMPSSAGEILLPRAADGMAALEQLQDGFAFARQAAQNTVAWGGKQHGLDEATAYFCYALRNATHGFGGERRSQAERDAALIAQHDGNVSHDLGFLALLYLLDMLANPARLRRILLARSRRG